MSLHKEEIDMIVTELIKIEDRTLQYTHSDSGRYVVRNGISYIEAYDPPELNRTYTEGDEIPSDESEETAQELLSILLGGENND